MHLFVNAVLKWKKNCDSYEFYYANYCGCRSELQQQCIFLHLVIKEQGNLKVFGKVTPNQLFPSTRYVQSEQFNS